MKNDQNAIQKLIELVKKDASEALPTHKKYSEREARIRNAFGDLQVGVNQEMLIKVFEVIVPKLHINDVADLVKEPNKSFIQKIASTPVLADIAFGVAKDSKDFRKDIPIVMDIVRNAYVENAKEGKVKIKVEKGVEAFRDILSDGKGGLDPKAIEFFKNKDNAKKWAAVSADPQAITRLPLKGERFSSPQHIAYMKNMLDHPNEHKSVFQMMSLTTFPGKFNKHNLETFNGLTTALAALNVKLEITNDPGREQVAAAFKSLVGDVSKIDAERIGLLNNAVLNASIAQYTSNFMKNEEAARCLLAKLQSLPKIKFESGTFEAHSVLYSAIADGVDKKNIAPIVDAIFNIAEMKTTFGKEVSRENLKAVVKSLEFASFKDAMNKNPELGKIILEEVKKIKGLGIDDQLKAFNQIHAGMALSVKENKSLDDVKKSEISKQVVNAIMKSEEGKFTKKVNLDKLQTNMQISQPEKPKDYEQALLNSDQKVSPKVAGGPVATKYTEKHTNNGPMDHPSNQPKESRLQKIFGKSDKPTKKSNSPTL